MPLMSFVAGRFARRPASPPLRSFLRRLLWSLSRLAAAAFVLFPALSVARRGRLEEPRHGEADDEDAAHGRAGVASDDGAGVFEDLRQLAVAEEGGGPLDLPG